MQTYRQKHRETEKNTHTQTDNVRWSQNIISPVIHRQTCRHTGRQREQNRHRQTHIASMKIRAQIHKRAYDNLKTIFGLTTILWQLANSQNIYDSLTTYLKTKPHDHLSDVLRQLGSNSVLRFILRYVIR